MVLTTLPVIQPDDRRSSIVNRRPSIVSQTPHSRSSPKHLWAAARIWRARNAFIACLTVILACSGGGTEPPPPVASVVVTPATSSLSPGQTTQLTAATRDAQGGNLTGRTVTWTSTNTAVATVSSSGMVTAVAVGGPVTIVASSEGQDGAATITVVPPPVASVTVAPATRELTPGATVQLSATMRDAAGNTLAGRVVSWSTSNNGVATVSSAGIVTAVALGGPVTITATSEGQTGIASVTVVAPVVTAVAVSPAATSVANGGTTPLTAVVRDQNNVILTGQVTAWTTSNPAVATVSPTGVVTGVSAGGPVTITATVAGKTGTSAVTVTSGPCDASIAITIGQTVSGTLTAADCPLADGSFMDQYQITIAANGRLQVDVTSAEFDAYLLLFLRNQDGTRVAVGADDNSGGGTNARIARDVVAGETYLIGANSLLANVTGAYQVSVLSLGMTVVAEGRTVISPREAEIARKKLALAARALR